MKGWNRTICFMSLFYCPLLPRASISTTFIELRRTWCVKLHQLLVRGEVPDADSTVRRHRAKLIPVVTNAWEANGPDPSPPPCHCQVHAHCAFDGYRCMGGAWLYPSPLRVFTFTL